MTSDAIGLDFGTTNSALAVLSDGAARLARFRPRDGGEAAPVFRSIVFFDPSGQEPGKPAPHYCGPDAIGRYLATDGEGRLMQSMKSHLASRSLDSTVVFGRRYRLEELIGGIVRALRLSAEADLGPLDGPVVAGRPIRFVGAKTASDDAFAEGRLRRALALGGPPPTPSVSQRACRPRCFWEDSSRSLWARSRSTRVELRSCRRFVRPTAASRTRSAISGCSWTTTSSTGATRT